MNYFVLQAFSSDGGYIDAMPEGGPEDFAYDKGVSLVTQYPRTAEVQFSRNFPDHRKLFDFQPNINRALIVSRRVRDVLERLEVSGVEYLPVAIKDHRGKVVADDYSILNPLGAQDAIDMARSSVRMGSLDKTQISRVKQMVLDRPKIDPTAKLFRCSTYRTCVIVREDVAAAFEKAKLTGYRTVPAEEWNGLWV